MATVNEVITLFERIAPQRNKCDFDNVGLIVGRGDRHVSRILVCLDVTGDVIEEAITLGAQLIISHHPMIFGGIKSVTDETVIGKKILTAVENGISIFACHTNLDFSVSGINDYVAEILGLEEVKVLDPYISENEGLGRVGKLPSRLHAGVLKGEVEHLFSDKYVRLIGEPYDFISCVAIINGAGGGDTEYIDMAKKMGADCLITADVKHHVAVYAKESGITIIEPQHYTMEHCYLTRLTQTLKIETAGEKIDVEIIQSQRDINPRF